MLPQRLCLLTSALTLLLVGAKAPAMGAPPSPSPLVQDGGPPKKRAKKNAGKKKAGQKKPAQGKGKQQPARKQKLSAPVRPPLPNPFIDAKPLTAAQAMVRFDINRDKRLDPRELKAARKDEANRKRLMNKLLREFDKDKNGSFDSAEMTRILGQQATIRRQATEAAYDKDGNNRLDENERQAMLRDLDAKREARAARVAGKGKGKSGAKPKPKPKADTKADAAEAESALRKQLMKRFDEDGDGKLSPEEFREMNLYIQEERIAAASTDQPQAEPKAKPKAKAEEALAKKPKTKLTKEERRALLLEKYDLDQDGKLSAEERAASKVKPAPEGPTSEPQAKPMQSAAEQAKPKRQAKRSNEERRALLLEKFDLDKDGKLSDEERAASKVKPAPEGPTSEPQAKPTQAAAEQAKPKRSNEERRALLLEKFDLDKDGKLSAEERAASKAKPAPEKPKAEPDAKPDSTPEAKPILTGAERQQRLLDRYDTDKDGKLNEEEHAVYLEDQVKRPKKSRGKRKGKGN